MAAHSSILAWKIPWTEEPGRLQSMGSLRVGHDWATSLSLFTFMHWTRKWQPTPVFLPGESQGWWGLVGCHLWNRTVRHDWSDLAAAAAYMHRIKKKGKCLQWRVSLFPSSCPSSLAISFTDFLHLKYHGELERFENTWVLKIQVWKHMGST